MLAMNPLSTMGTVINEKAIERIEAMLQSDSKAKILAGGKRLTGKSALDQYEFSRGSFFPPTVVTNVSTQSALWREEVFGPGDVAAFKFSGSNRRKRSRALRVPTLASGRTAEGSRLP